MHRAAGFELVGRYERIGWKFEAWHDVLVWRIGLGAEHDAPARLRSVRDAWAQLQTHPSIAPGR